MDIHSAVDDAIADTDRLQRFIARTRSPQIRNGEQRDFLKATALSWFRSRRPTLVGILGADLLSAIDKPYRRILDATDRNSARATYVGAGKDAKTALALARQALLEGRIERKEGPANDPPPDFSSLASDQTMQEILVRRWNECHLCLSVGAALAATVMMGGLLEALFVARANKLRDKAPIARSALAPKDHKTGKTLELRQWTLAPYIDVGHDLKWISSSAKDVAVVLRDYRNYIHPEKERSHGIVLTNDDAKMLWEVTKTLSRELLALKGAS